MEGTPEQQVQQLKEEYERKLAEINARSSEVSENNTESQPSSVEHQALSETTEKIIQEQVPEFKASSHEPGRGIDDEIAPEAQAKVQEWINLSLANPSAGVKTAKESGDIGLIDIYHGALTSDAIYQEMVKRGKLQELK